MPSEASNSHLISLISSVTIVSWSFSGPFIPFFLQSSSHHFLWKPDANPSLCYLDRNQPCVPSAPQLSVARVQRRVLTAGFVTLQFTEIWAPLGRAGSNAVDSLRLGPCSMYFPSALPLCRCAIWDNFPSSAQLSTEFYVETTINTVCITAQALNREEEKFMILAYLSCT